MRNNFLAVIISLSGVIFFSTGLIFAVMDALRGAVFTMLIIGLILFCSGLRLLSKEEKTPRE